MRRSRVVIILLFSIVLVLYVGSIWYLTATSLIDLDIMNFRAAIWAGIWVEGVVFSFINTFSSGSEAIGILRSRSRAFKKVLQKVNSDTLLVGSWWFARSDALQYLCCLFMTLAGISAMFGFFDPDSRTLLIFLGGGCLALNQILNRFDREEMESRLNESEVMKLTQEPG